MPGAPACMATTIAFSAEPGDERRRDRQDRDLWLDLCAMARQLLSARSAAIRRAVLCQPAGRHDRDQRHVLRAAAPRCLCPVVDETPEEFVFAVKGPRFITHIRRLRDIETPLANFFASGVLRLEEKLGPVLWQFPASFRFSAERLDHFFSLLPWDTEAAASLAEHRSDWLAKRAWAKTGQRRELRHAIEIRHESFLDPAFVALLRRYRVALVFADSVSWPYAEDFTADFVYLRLHGSEELYASGYSDEALAH